MSKLGVDKIITGSQISNTVTQNSHKRNNKKKKKNKMSAVTAKNNDVSKEKNLEEF